MEIYQHYSFKNMHILSAISLLCFLNVLILSMYYSNNGK